MLCKTVEDTDRDVASINTNLGTIHFKKHTDEKALEYIPKSLRIRLGGCGKYLVDTADSYDENCCFPYKER